MSEELTKQAGNNREDPSLSSSGEGMVVTQGWRADPEESYSDWMIEISVDGAIHGSYHVHKYVLAFGPKRSEYFVRLFANRSLKEHQTHTSRIEMEELAAESFPLMLDYMYSLWGNGENPITAENVVALHYFGRYFEIGGLQKEARTFWEKTMTIDQAVTYLEHAMVFHDDRMFDAVAEKCASSIYSIEVNSRLMELSDTKFWRAVLQANKNKPNRVLSTLVSAFCSTHQELLDSESFLQLTDKSVLPQLSAAAAMELLQLEQVFVPTSAVATELSSLQERGIDALNSCSSMDHSVLTELMVTFKDTPHQVLLQMLQRSITNSQHSSNRNTRTPERIIVSDAGIDAVNGVYARAAQLRENAPYYVMDGSWEDGPARFELYLWDADYWYISILNGADPDDDEVTNFYEVPGVVGETWRLPPTKGWEHFDEMGDGATPTLFFDLGGWTNE